MCLNASLAGLVGITAGCANVDALGATIIGLVDGILVVIAVEFIDQKLKIDDPVGAVAVHGCNGLWGTVAVGLSIITMVYSMAADSTSLEYRYLVLYVSQHTQQSQ